MPIPQKFSETLLNISRVSAIVAASAGTFSTTLTSISCGIMLASWIFSGQSLATLTASWQHQTGKMIIAFFSVLTLGLFYCDASWNARLLTLWSWRKLFYGFILLGLFYSRYWKRMFVNSYLVAMLIALLLSYLAWLEVIPSKGAVLGVLAANYQVQGMAFIVATICSITLLKEAMPRMQFAYAGIIFAYSLNILFLNPGRSGYLALVAGALIAGVANFGRKKIPHVIAIALVTVVIAATNSETMQSRFRQGFGEAINYQHSDHLTSVGTRMVFIENSLELIGKKPVFGYGTGSYGTEYSHYVKTKYSDWRATPVTDPHDQYLYVLFEHGLIGLSVFIGLLATLFWVAIRSGAYGIMAAGVLIAWTVSSFFNSHFKTFHEGHLLGLFLGAMLAGSSGNDAKKPPES